MSVVIKDNTDKYLNKLSDNLGTYMEDVALDLTSAARSSAPHLTGALEKGINSELSHNKDTVKITISATEKDDKGYDYAPKMHDGKYNLGEQSLAKPSGTSGISKQEFGIGSGYIINPLELGFDSYVRYLSEGINKSNI